MLTCRGIAYRSVITLLVVYGSCHAAHGQRLDKPLSSSPTPGSELPRFVYFFGSAGEFLKLDAANLGTFAQWLLPRLPSAADLLPPYSPPHTRGNYGRWIPSSLRFDGKYGRIYGVFPKPYGAAAPSSEALQVLGLQLPFMDVLGQAGFPLGLDTPPSILVSPDGRRIFAGYWEPVPTGTPTGTLVRVLEIYTGGKLAKEQSLRETVSREDYMQAKALVNTLFSPDAYFSQDGKTVFDGTSRIEVGPQGWFKSRVNPLGALTVQQRAQLRAFGERGENEPPPQEWAVSDSAAGRTLVFSINRTHTRAVFWTVDLMTENVTSFIDGPIAVGHLSPDGKRVVLEEAELRLSGPPVNNYRTGRFLVFDVDSGQQVGEVRHEELAGFHSRSLCIYPDGSAMFYLAGEKEPQSIYRIELTGNARPMRINSSFPADEFTQCVFADR